MAGLRTISCMNNLSRNLLHLCLRDNVAPLSSRGLRTESVVRKHPVNPSLYSVSRDSKIISPKLTTSQNNHEFVCPSHLKFKQPSIVILDQSITTQGVMDCPTLPQTLQDIIAPEGRIQEISEPVSEHEPVKEARNILKIRRRKMNRHLLKKFRKRMLFTLRKQRQRMRKKKRNIFEAELEGIRRKAREFDAEQHIHNELEEARRGGFYINILAKDSR